ncbi:amidohydrolase family protein [Halorarum halobium]|uniref:amidohydrolase family protein n=1 Tax=Halorarum halobium TaxID=3075121 RepID=UPI0028B1A6C0|nr:amidohydrolase family protein [Halobaculum sp. XH14]
MSDLLLENVGRVVTGDPADPTKSVESIHVRDGVIEELGASATTADTVIDVRGTTVVPGLIDAHVHPVAGGYTPRQNTLGWCESYLHGGVTSMVSAGEIHHPGRPADAAGTKSLAVLNRKSYGNHRPGGVKLHAGTLVLTDDLAVEDVEEVRRQGVERTKIIFAMADLDHAHDLVARAKELGMVTMMHAGGASVPGTRSIGEEQFRRVEPDVALHFNGGPTAMPDDEWRALLADTDMDLELVVAGNQRTAGEILSTLADRDELDRLQIATDTPTGTGVVPCGMWLEASFLASTTDVSAAELVCLMTGTPAAHHGLDAGRIEPGRPADLCILDAPQGSAADDALGAIEHGDYPSVDTVLVDGEVLVDGSRNTGPAKRPAEIL